MWVGPSRDESLIGWTKGSEPGGTGTVYFGEYLHECLPESGVDPSIDDWIICCVGHGEPVTPKVDVNESFRWAVYYSLGVDAQDKVDSVHGEPSQSVASHDCQCHYYRL